MISLTLMQLSLDLKKEKLTSPLFNTKQYTKDLEKIYSNLYQDFKNSF